MARAEIERFLERPVYLQLNVQVGLGLLGPCGAVVPLAAAAHIHVACSTNLLPVQHVDVDVTDVQCCPMQPTGGVPFACAT